MTTYLFEHARTLGEVRNGPMGALYRPEVATIVRIDQIAAVQIVSVRSEGAGPNYRPEPGRRRCSPGCGELRESG